MSGQRTFAELRALIESGLDLHLPESKLKSSGVLPAAIHYAMFPGGKRLRPILTLLAGELAGGRAEQALPAACAIEFLHTASLIIDDLPCMDDEHLRRGKDALHRRFGEDVAILAALALLNQAYAIFARTPRLMREAAECIGLNGMIGGQALDLGTRASSRSERYRKTSALMRLTLTAGALSCAAPARKVRQLARAGEALGDAYQMWDDLADFETGEQPDAPEHRLGQARAILLREFDSPQPILEAIEMIASAMRQPIPAAVASLAAGAMAQV